MARSLRYSFLLLVLTAYSVRAQYERFLHKDYRGRAKEWGNFWAEKTVNAEYDSALFFKELSGIRQTAVTHKDEGLEMDTYMGELSFFLYRKKYSDQTALAVLERTLKMVKKKRVLQEASVEKHFGVFYFYRLKNYELAFEHFLHMYELVKNVSKRVFPDKTNCLKELASAYYYFEDYSKTIELAKAAIRSEWEVGESAHLCRNYGLVGICFRKLNQLDSSDRYFKASLETATAKHDTLWMGINYGELGYNAFERQQFDRALPLLQQALSIVKPRQEETTSAKVLIRLGAMALLKGKDKEAESLLTEAKKYADRQRQLELYSLLYPWLLKLYVRLKRPQLALMYSDSAVWAKDSLQRQFSSRKILRAVQANQLRQHRAEVTAIETQKKMKEWERNGILALLVIGFGLALYIYSNQRKRYFQNQQIAAQQLQLKDRELHLASQQLQQFARSISEKNALIEELQQKPVNEETYRIIDQLQRATILTDEQWEHFRQLFEKVHSGYLYRVKEKVPGLTPAEIRFVALAKLQFSTKETAAVLGISPNSVRSGWSRLRKKLNLPEETTPEELLEIIG
ncbi:MAG: hypothetical protein U0X91_29575 [Spirosomataceae bacterium]